MMRIKFINKKITSISFIFLFTLIPFLKVFPIKTFFISTFLLAQSNTKIYSEEFNEDKYVLYRKRFYESVQKGDYSGAIKALNQLIKIENHNFLKSGLYVNRGVYKGKLGDIKGEENDYRKAIALNEKEYHAYLNLGVLKISTGNISDALSFFEKGIKVEPKKFLGYYRIAQTKYLHLEEKDLPGAIYYYKKAIEVDPKHPLVAKTYRDLGTIMAMDKENFTASIFYFSKAISIDPKFSSAYHNRGSSKRFIGDLKGACSDYKLALSLGYNKSLKEIKKFC